MKINISTKIVTAIMLCCSVIAAQIGSISIIKSSAIIGLEANEKLIQMTELC